MIDEKSKYYLFICLFVCLFLFVVLVVLGSKFQNFFHFKGWWKKTPNQIEKLNWLRQYSNSCYCDGGGWSGDDGPSTLVIISLEITLWDNQFEWFFGFFLRFFCLYLSSSFFFFFLLHFCCRTLSYLFLNWEEK